MLHNDKHHFLRKQVYHYDSYLYVSSVYAHTMDYLKGYEHGKKNGISGGGR
ncbi:MAG: hypothetical protein WAK17_00860 [Candidatus Nitrosopolaris sp.]